MKNEIELLTWKDVVKIHIALRERLYRSGQEIFEREAELLNKLIKEKLEKS